MDSAMHCHLRREISLSANSELASLKKNYANELSNVVNIPGLTWKSWNSRKDTCRIGTHENQNLGLEDFLDDEHLFRLWGKPGVCCVHLYGMCLILLYPCI